MPASHDFLHLFADVAVLAPYLLSIARFHARRKGLSPEDAEDCAAEFVVRILAEIERSPVLSQGSPALLHWRAKNFAEDCRRAEASRRRRETPQSVWPQGALATRDRADDQPTPEERLFLREFWKEMRSVLKQVGPEPRRFFIHFYLRGASIKELAEASGRTPHAVEQALLRTRHRVRAILERRGVTEAELRAFLPLPRSR